MTGADKRPYFPSRLPCPFLSCLGNLVKFLETVKQSSYQTQSDLLCQIDKPFVNLCS